ncbi:hypothetical protein BGZ46_008020 [Entomortierella lignicola]|nr:hypothetical protein BGZ46_008020 [Entomortierella lignicola]
MGAVTSSLQQTTDWVTGGRNQTQRSRRRGQRRRVRTDGAYGDDLEAHGDELYSDDEDSSDYSDDDNDDSVLEGEEATSDPGKTVNESHPLYFGPAFHPVIEQSPAQLQLQRQIEQQLELQQYRQHQQQQQQQQNQQQLSSLSSVGGQQLSLNDFVLPSAISGLSGISAGGGTQSGRVSNPGSPTLSSPPNMHASENFQDQLYRNSNLYNLISGLNVNALLTEVQRAGTLDLSVLEQELDDVEGGWIDIDEDEQVNGQDDDDTDIDYGHEGIVREMQPTKRSPTALACSINLKKSTLRMVKNFSVSKDPSIPAPSHLRPNYRLDFSFDSLTPCDVKLFWVVKEVEEDGELGFRLRRLHHLPQPTTYHFPAGMNQRFISPILPLYTMSLPELTMQGLPSTSMRLFQKRNQRLWQQYNPMDKDPDDVDREWNDEGGNGVAMGRRKSKSKSRKKNKTGNSFSGEGYYKKQANQYPMMDEEDNKHIMEDQYFPLVIVIEAAKEYKATAPVRSLPTPVANSPGVYLIDNQAISTFACFNISSEGGFEIKVMKQKVWINSTNYLIQEIYGFTDSVSSSTPPNSDNSTKRKSTITLSNEAKTRHTKRQDNRMSRLSRAESIASRVDELTMDRLERKKSRTERGEEEDDNKTKNKGASTSLSRRASKSSTVLDLNITEPKNSNEEEPRSQETQDGDVQDDVTNDTPQEPEEETTQAEDEEAKLVLLDAPECVICLSDVKDTIVLPFFQALLHIASAPTRAPDFITSPTSVSASASVTTLPATPEVPVNGSNGNDGDYSMRF